MARRRRLQRAIELQPDHVPAAAALVVVETRAGDFDAAVAAARGLQVRRPEAPDGYALEGDAQRHKGDRAAAAAYRRLLEFDGPRANGIAQQVYRILERDQAGSAPIATLLEDFRRKTAAPASDSTQAHENP